MSEDPQDYYIGDVPRDPSEPDWTLLRAFTGLVQSMQEHSQTWLVSSWRVPGLQLIVVMRTITHAAKLLADSKSWRQGTVDKVEAYTIALVLRSAARKLLESAGIKIMGREHLEGITRQEIETSESQSDADTEIPWL